MALNRYKRQCAVLIVPWVWTKERLFEALDSRLFLITFINFFNRDSWKNLSILWQQFVQYFLNCPFIYFNIKYWWCCTIKWTQKRTLLKNERRTKKFEKFQQIKINIYWEFYYFINSFNVLWFWWRIDLKCFTANKKINILWSIDFLIEIRNNPVHFAIKNP